MNKPISSGLKTLFLVHFIIGLIFGLVFLLIPQIWLPLFGWKDVPDPFAWRLLGAAVLALTATSWFSYSAHLWDQVRIVVWGEVVWTTLGAIVCLWAQLTNAFPVGGWINFVILVGLAIAFWYFYFQHEAAPVPAAPKAPAPKPAARKVSRRGRARA